VKAGTMRGEGYRTIDIPLSLLGSLLDQVEAVSEACGHSNTAPFKDLEATAWKLFIWQTAYFKGHAAGYDAGCTAGHGD
jgi:hypothetical protein